MSDAQVGMHGAVHTGDDHWYLPGEHDPASGRPIKSIIYQTREFIVSIDKKNELNWTSKMDIQYAPDFGEIESSVSLSENLAERLFWRKNCFSYKKMLGGVMVRILADKNSDSAKSMLKEINNRIQEHGKESVRMAYIYCALFGLAFCAAGLSGIAIRGSYISLKLNSGTPIYETMGCGFLGGIGAFISTFFRFRNYTGSLVAGLPIHRLDGALRIVYGMTAGLLLSFAVKGNILAGFADASNDTHWILYFLAMVAGASEILVPNLIKQTEEGLSIKKQNEGNHAAEANNNPSEEQENEAAEPDTASTDGEEDKSAITQEVNPVETGVSPAGMRSR